MAAGLGRHNSSCATAIGHKCECTGCGGRLHGYEGWLAVASAVDKRQERQQWALAKWSTYRPRGGRRGVRAVRLEAKAAGIDIARLDIAEWLGGHERDGRVDGGLVTHHDRESSADQDQLVTVEQLTVFARELTLAGESWPDIVSELSGDPAEAREISWQLAQHVWCDILVALVRVVENYQEVLSRIPDRAKDEVKRMVLDTDRQRVRDLVTAKVVDVVVDRVWKVFFAMVAGNVPVLGVLNSKELLRSLRILAVFICPAPEKHPEVLTDALRPLAGDAERILSEETKTRLGELFKDWIANRPGPGTGEKAI